jgi:DNA-directed RNA polymerase specialized sigma24 family protein
LQLSHGFIGGEVHYHASSSDCNWLRFALRSAASFRSAARRDVLDRLPGPGLNPEQALAKKESILALTKEVARLSPPLRSVVILCDIPEYSMEEAGAVLSVTKDTVREADCFVQANSWEL